MSDLSFIHNLPSEFTGYYLVPANNRYPCTWGYTSTKEVYHLIQLIGGGQYLFVVTDNDYNYLGHSYNFTEANKLGQEYNHDEKESEYSIFAVDNQSGELIYSRPLKGDDLLDCDSYLNEINQNLGLERGLELPSINAGWGGDVTLTIAASLNSVVVWESKGYYYNQDEF